MSDCIFCKIAAGLIKATLVYEDDRVVAFPDINPQAPVHILIIPKKHIERVSALSDQDFSLVVDIHKAAKKLAEKHGLDKSGFRLVTNNGAGAGQSVDHLHYHMLGGRAMKWPPG